jgi:hypothetical protein
MTSGIGIGKNGDRLIGLKDEGAIGPWPKSLACC